jgi:hypothetical protein
VKEAIRHQSMFNLLQIPSGEKVDFWMLTAQPWDQKRFERRIEARLFGRNVWVTTPEDTILAKLRWSKLSGGSEKQLNDALRVYEVQRPHLDLDYISEWSKTLDVEELWERVMIEADADV